jgi:hypothetical protein
MDAVAKEKKQKKEFKKRLRFLINQNDFKGAADYLTENRLKHGRKFSRLHLKIYFYLYIINACY